MYTWLVLILTLILIFLNYLYRKLQYWQRKGVKTLEENSFFGNWGQLESMNHMELLDKLYGKYKNTEKLVGFYIYTKPVAVILDLDLVKTVLVKDFNKFSDRFVYKNEKDLLTENLLFWEGEKWRPMRAKFTSIFTPSKIKYMFSTISSAALQLKETVDECRKSDAIVNITDLSGRFTTHVIAACILGTQCKSLKSANDEFHQIAKQTTGATGFNIRWQLFRETYVSVLQAAGIDVNIFPKAIEDFFMGFLKGNFIERENLDIRCNDLLDLMIDLRKVKDENCNPGLTHNEIASNMFLFFAAGYESSANTICFTLMELSRQPDLQNKARAEVMSVLKQFNNELSYEACMKMTYLDQIMTGKYTPREIILSR